jgi:1-acyl-sn-glycerol-3-phosphate acyltransferase
MIRTLLVMLVALVLTPLLGTLVIIASILGLDHGGGGLFDWAPRAWSRALLWAGGVRVHLHDPERMRPDRPQIYVANHVSWFDVFTLAAILPRPKFIAKAELGRIPLFGRASRACGMIFIDRDNRKAAFAGYEDAARRIERGASVVVFPEGTRGRTYDIRPFKKGPFVLAVASAAPIVPTVLHGTREVFGRGAWRVRGGDVHVHFLEPVPTAGLTYEDRDRLSREVAARMSESLRAVYRVGVSADVPTQPLEAASA